MACKIWTPIGAPSTVSWEARGAVVTTWEALLNLYTASWRDIVVCPRITGHGTLAVAPPALDGTARFLAQALGDGVLYIASPTLVGQGSFTELPLGAGLLALAVPAATGTARFIAQINGDGLLAFAAPALQGTGTKLFIVHGTAALSVAPPGTVGTARFIPRAVGTGTLSMAALELGSTARFIALVSGDGLLTFAAPAAIGTARFIAWATGAGLTYLAPPSLVAGGSFTAAWTGFLRPDADFSSPDWGSTGANYYTEIDETSRSDTDYAKTTVASGVLHVGLAAPGGTPGSGATKTIRCAVVVAETGPPDPLADDATLELLNGTTSIQTFALATGANTLTVTNSISNWSDLRVKVTSDSGIVDDEFRVTWLELEVS